MSNISIVVNILAGIAVLIIICYIIKYLWDLHKHRKNLHINFQINPPGSYMQNSGVKCPDYWVNTGIDSNGNYICKNSFNIQSNNPTTGNCANKCNSNEAVFSPIKSGFTWEYNNPNGLTSYSDDDKINFVKKNGSAPNSRCDWINCCGAATGVNGVWTGVSDYCDMNAGS
jgi:hypothetical protein